MLVHELFLELLEAMEQLFDSGFIRHCERLEELQREWQYMSTQVLHNVLVWEALREVGILQALVNLWGSLLDLDFQLIHSSLVSLCDSMIPDWPGARQDPDKVLCLLAQGKPWLAQTEPGLLVQRLQEVFDQVEEDDDEDDDEDEEYNIEEDNYNRDTEGGYLLLRCLFSKENQLSIIFARPQDYASPLGASHILAKHSLDHLCTLRNLLRDMSQPHILKPLHCLQELLTVLQDPQCWALLVQSQSW